MKNAPGLGPRQRRRLQAMLGRPAIVYERNTSLQSQELRANPLHIRVFDMAYHDYYQIYGRETITQKILEWVVLLTPHLLRVRDRLMHVVVVFLLPGDREMSGMPDYSAVAQLPAQNHRLPQACTLSHLAREVPPGLLELIRAGMPYQ